MDSEPEAYFEPLGGGRFAASELTQGPWAPEQQHGGPPSALLGGQMDRLAPRPEMAPARIVVEFLGPVPVGEVAVTTAVVRDGGNVQLVAGELSVDGRVCLTAQLWRVRRAELDGLPGPGAGAPADLPPAGATETPRASYGYARSVEWRFVKGSLGEPGPATAWVRCARPIVRGEEPSALERALVVADSGSGISAVLEWGRWVWPNLDLSVYFSRLPEGEWLCLDAESEVGDAGAGVTRTRLYDERGPFGSAAQALFVSPVPGQG